VNGGASFDHLVGTGEQRRGHPMPSAPTTGVLAPTITSGFRPTSSVASNALQITACPAIGVPERPSSFRLQPKYISAVPTKDHSVASSRGLLAAP
jgi:hypothetical protein